MSLTSWRRVTPGGRLELRTGYFQHRVVPLANDVNQNERSSRSHSVFTIVIESRPRDGDNDEDIRLSRLVSFFSALGPDQADQSPLESDSV